MASGLGFWLDNRARLTTSFCSLLLLLLARPASPVPLMPLVAGRPFICSFQSPARTGAARSARQGTCGRPPGRQVHGAHEHLVGAIAAHDLERQVVGHRFGRSNEATVPVKHLHMLDGLLGTCAPDGICCGPFAAVPLGACCNQFEHLQPARRAHRPCRAVARVAISCDLHANATPAIVDSEFHCKTNEPRHRS
jgi:hypothetical protein